VGIISFLIGKSLSQPKTSPPSTISQLSPTSTPFPTPTTQIPTPTPTTNPTANWTMYRADEYGFEFRYPSHWFLQGKMIQSPSGDESLSIMVNSPGFGVECYKTIKEETTYKNSLKVIKNYAQGIKSDLCDNQNNALIWTVIGGQNNRIDLIYTYKISKEKESKDFFDLILSTFKFFDPTNNWKTYFDSDKLKISFKYPPDWSVGFETHIGKASPVLSSPCDYEKGQRCATLQIFTETFERGRKLEDYFHFDFNGKWPDQIIERKKLSVGGEEALAIEYFQGNYFYGSSENERGRVLIMVKIVRNQTVYTITFSEEGKDRNQIKTSADWQNKAIFNQIISTFKFLD
jgi:hypothetical protein